MSENTKNVIYNASKGYGYSYASLADIAMQGFAIPKMKTVSEEDKEYVYYYDADLSEWLRGAQVVIPESKGMNKAQLYGSALTYARRYTTLLALCLACGDDKAIEDIDADGQRKSSYNSVFKPYTKEQQEASPEQIEAIKNAMYGNDNLSKLKPTQKQWIIEKGSWGITSEDQITEEIATEFFKLLGKKSK